MKHMLKLVGSLGWKFPFHMLQGNVELQMSEWQLHLAANTVGSSNSPPNKLSNDLQLFPPFDFPALLYTSNLFSISPVLLTFCLSVLLWPLFIVFPALFYLTLFFLCLLAETFLFQLCYEAIVRTWRFKTKVHNHNKVQYALYKGWTKYKREVRAFIYEQSGAEVQMSQNEI